MFAMGGKRTFALYVQIVMKLLYVATVAALVAGCDGYTHKGKDGPQSRAKADTMPLPEAYSFYVETYRGTSPPMLEVAGTLRRFGPQGTAYVVERALQTTDAEEFNAVAHALRILDYRCTAEVAGALQRKKAAVGAYYSACPG